MIICHGFTGDKYEYGRFTKTAIALNEARFDALIFDFSGSGENEREFITLSKQARDLENVYAWARIQGYTMISVIGLSFGGLTALISELPDVKTYVFWAPAFNLKGKFFVSIEEILKKKTLKLPTSGNCESIIIDYTFVEDLLDYDVNSYLQKLSTPALIIQGTKDRSVRLSHTKEAFKFLPQNNHHKLIEIDKATHNFDGDHLKRFIEASINWLKNYL